MESYGWMVSDWLVAPDLIHHPEAQALLFGIRSSRYVGKCGIDHKWKYRNNTNNNNNHHHHHSNNRNDNHDNDNNNNNTIWHDMWIWDITWVVIEQVQLNLYQPLCLVPKLPSLSISKAWHHEAWPEHRACHQVIYRIYSLVGGFPSHTYNI